jgi:type IV pilus assembly protein PilY1
MWKFDLNAGTAAKIVAFGSTKPIEVAPEIAYLNGKKVIYFGTGRYLGTSDLTDTSVQSIYAVLDDGSAALTDTSTLVQKTLTTSGSNRTIAASTVDWSTKHGWYFNLPDTGERVSTDLQLYFGTLVVASVVPTATDCQPGGYSWLYQLDYNSGGMVSGATTAGLKYTSPIVGLTVVKLATGTPIVYPITADGQKPSPDVLNIPASSSAGGVRRVLWRELPD